MLIFPWFNPVLPGPLFSSKQSGKRKAKKMRTPEEKAQRKAAKQAQEKALAQLLLARNLLVHDAAAAAEVAHKMRKNRTSFLIYSIAHLCKELSPGEAFNVLSEEEEALVVLQQALQTLRSQME